MDLEFTRVLFGDPTVQRLIVDLRNELHGRYGGRDGSAERRGRVQRLLELVL